MSLSEVSYNLLLMSSSSGETACAASQRVQANDHKQSDSDNNKSTAIQIAEWCKMWTHFLGDCNGFDVGAKVKPQGQQSWPGLVDVAMTVLHCQTVIAYDLRQDLQMRLIFS